MRKKELKLVVTFHTTADAMAMEKACQELHVPGRTYPCSERNLGGMRPCLVCASRSSGAGGEYYERKRH